MDRFFHLHTHSNYSSLDGMGTVDDIVSTTVELGHAGVSLTDHGNLSGALRLYKRAAKNGLVPFPGIEAYVVNDANDLKAKRYHLGLLALSHSGYKEIARLSTMSQQPDRYHFKPRIDFADLAAADLSEVAITTGCYFGLLTQTLIGSGNKAALAVLRTYQSWCPNVYVEIQHHHTDHGDGWDDTMLANALYDLADQRGAPIVITQDAHYCDPSEKTAHDMMKTLVMHGPDVGDVTFPGDSYHLASTAWVKKHYQIDHLMHIWNAAQPSYDSLLSLNKIDFPALNNYRFQVPNPYPGEEPSEMLRKAVDEWYFKTQQPTDSNGTYRNRIDYELDVIDHLGMAPYFLLVADYVQYARDQKILVMARGSANASLVCYALGITQLDPISWSLTFERFLSKDRKKPPDIDLDIEDVYRDEIVKYVKEKYGAVQIGTYNSLSTADDGDRGSVFVKFMSAMRRSDPKGFPSKYGRLKGLNDLYETDPDTADVLRRLGNMDVKTNPGAHPAGFVLSAPELPMEEYLPSMAVGGKNGKQVTQMTMDDVEEAGYVKADFLGSRTLHTIARTAHWLSKDPYNLMETIPLGDPETLQAIRRGDTLGMFQFEGWTSQRGCREMKVRSMKDLVLVLALYRPATLDNGMTAQFLENRKPQNRKTVYYPHQFAKKVLKETHGIVVFQEQVMELLREMGMSVKELNDFLGAIKVKSGDAEKASLVMQQHKSNFDVQCFSHNMDQEGADFMWQAVEGFSGYGFNRAHASAYSLIGYWTAYLKTHHPLEFYCALLETTNGDDSHSDYVRAARASGIKFARVNVNKSKSNYTIDRDLNNTIRRGLMSVDGIGEMTSTVIEERAPYTSITELIEKTPARPITGGRSWKTKRTLNGVLGILDKAGALSTLDREA